VADPEEEVEVEENYISLLGMAIVINYKLSIYFFAKARVVPS